MPDNLLAARPEPAIDRRALCRKVTWRILPLLFVLYIVAYLDRVNAGFAKLQMKESLGFSERDFGLALGFFFFTGYLLLEIPGALLVERWSARKWFARILISWGLCSALTALVRTPAQFYLARFLLGLAEAGFFPGLIVYFTHWFPRAERTRALAGLVLAIPVSMGLGAQLSGWVLELNGLGLEGWQWVFVAEGLPAVLLGLAVPFLMTDRPAQARWLQPAERAWLERTLEAERREAAAAGGATFRVALRLPTVWLLALGILLTNMGGYGLALWLPTAVKQLLHETRGVADNAAVLNWTGLVYACGLPGVWLSGQLSDRTGQRKWLCVGAQVLTGIFLAVSVIPGQSWAAVFAWLCLVGFFAVAWPPPFWVLPTLTLSASAAAVSIAIINMCANLAGAIGPSVVGFMKEYGLTDRVCLVFLAGCYVAGGAVVAMLRVPRRSQATVGP